MPLAMGIAPTSNLRLGDTQTQRAYLGTVLVWQYGTAQTWTRSTATVTVAAVSGAWSATAHQTWTRSVGVIAVNGITRGWGVPQVWLASTTTTVLEDGELVYWFGDQVVDGRVGGVTVVGVSGTWGASQHLTWVRSVAMVTVSGTSRTWAVAQTWTRSVASVAVTGTSGAWAKNLIFVRSVATIGVTGASGTWAVTLHQTWTRSTATVTTSGVSGTWGQHLLWTRSTATVAVTGTSGTWARPHVWTGSTATVTASGASGVWSVASTAGVAEFVAIGAKSAGSTTTISVAHPAGTAADQILIAGRCTWRSTSEFDPSDESGWTNSGELAGGTGTAVDAHTTIVRADRKELSGADAGPTSFDQTGTPSTTGGGMGVMASYKKYSGSWAVATATGDDNNHAANRSATASTTIAFQPGDTLVAIVAVDTDAVMTTITSPALTASGITFGTTNRRTVYPTNGTAGVGTGNDGNIELFDATVTAGTGTVAPTLAFTTAVTQCGPVAFVRLRGGPAVVPGAPVVTPTAGDTQVTLSWTTPSTGGAVITGYVVEKSPDGSSSWTAAGTPSASPHTVTGLTNTVIQYFRVAAVNSVGQGAWSSTVSATPDVPGGPVVDASSPAIAFHNDGIPTTASFTPPAGSRLLCGFMPSDYAAPTCTSAGLTFTTIGTHDTTNRMYFWISSVVPSATARTVAFDDGGGSFGGQAHAKVWVLTGVNATTPIGANSATLTETTNNNWTASGYTSTATNSLGFAIAKNFCNPTLVPSSTDTYETANAASVWEGLWIRKAAATSTSGTSVTFNADAGSTTTQWRLRAVEVLP